MAVIYIAGPMTGYEDYNRTEFSMATIKLKYAGHAVLNPGVLPDGLSQHST